MRLCYSLKVFGILAIISMIAGCDPLNNPIDTKRTNSQVKTETKWQCDPVTKSKISKVYNKQFDKEGNLLNHTEYNDAGQIAIETNYTYSNNESREEKKYYNASGVTDSINISAYVLDNNGKIQQKIRFNTNGDTIGVSKYNYDNMGNVISKVEISNEGKVISEVNYHYTYNQKGELVERLTNPGTNGHYQSRDTLIYNTGNQQVERLNYNSSGIIETKFTYYYSVSGQLIKEEEKKDDGSLLRLFTYEYQYY